MKGWSGSERTPGEGACQEGKETSGEIGKRRVSVEASRSSRSYIRLSRLRKKAHLRRWLTRAVLRPTSHRTPPYGWTFLRSLGENEFFRNLLGRIRDSERSERKRKHLSRLATNRPASCSWERSAEPRQECLARDLEVEGVCHQLAYLASLLPRVRLGQSASAPHAYLLIAKASAAATTSLLKNAARMPLALHLAALPRPFAIS